MDKPAASAAAADGAAAKNDKPVSLVVDDVPVPTASAGGNEAKIWSWRLTSAVRCRFI
jgi:hypothetical protein